MLREIYHKLLPVSIRNKLKLGERVAYWRYARSFSIPFLVLVVGQACNYRCRDCGNFAPYAPVEFMRYKLQDIIDNLSCVLDNVHHIDLLQIQGGEPFLYSELDKLIKFVSDSKKVRQIVIATNGSIMPDDCLLNELLDAGVHVRISDYDITPAKTAHLKETLQKKGIAYSFYSFAGDNGYWYNLGPRSFARAKEREDDTVVSQRYAECGFAGCLTLERGQLARCSRGNNAPRIQGFCSKEGDYLAVSSNEKYFKKALMDYCYHPRYMEACRYCNGTDPEDMIPAARQISAKGAKNDE